MIARRRVLAFVAASAPLLLLGACGGGESAPADESGADGAPATADAEDTGEDGVWFSIDEEAGTVTDEQGTYPIAFRGVLTVDGEDYEFVGNLCPIPESGIADEIGSFHGYGYAPDGRPFNFNGGRNLSFNITYDEDWRSTNTTFDAFNPDWSVSGNEMRIESLEVEDTAAGESLPAAIVITCS